MGVCEERLSGGKRLGRQFTERNPVIVGEAARMGEACLECHVSDRQVVSGNEPFPSSIKRTLTEVSGRWDTEGTSEGLAKPPIRNKRHVST
jgi:hypothetical protein